jgi:copper chaperone CopZ
MTSPSKLKGVRSSGTLITTFGEMSPTEVFESVKKLNGVSSVRVNPVRRSVQVEYDPTLANATMIRAACRASSVPMLGIF